VVISIALVRGSINRIGKQLAAWRHLPRGHVCREAMPE
jgi:hypothetical protein